MLSAKDDRRRELVLSGNLWRVILLVGAPLAIYQSLNQLFKIFDTMMAAHISAQSVSAVAYLSQITGLLGALGGGLAVGSSIKISQAYGSGDYDLVKKRVSTLYFMTTCLGALALIIIPFTKPILAFVNTPPEFIESGTLYFNIGLVELAVIFFNNTYIAMERAKGNTTRILWLNLAVIFFKLSITAFFVYVLRGDITMIAIAGLLANLAMCVAGIIEISKKGSIFSFSAKAICLTGECAPPMLRLSAPVMVEKVAFSMGKVIVNSMSTSYGALTVGALGISNNIGGITTNPQSGFQDAGSSVISQNIGAGNYKRAVEAFKKLFVINVAIGIIGYILTVAFLPQLASAFAANDAEFASLIQSLYAFEAVGCIFLGACSAVMAVLYGFGYTRITLVINFCRVFVFRVPVLWALQHFTDLGSKSVGIVMAVSNVLVSVLACILCAIAMHHICLKHNIKFWNKRESS